MKKPTQRVLAAALSVLLLALSLPTSVQAGKSDDIRQEINGLKSKNKDIQAELNGIQSKYNANAGEIEDMVAQKDAIDQEINLMAEQIENINQQVESYSQLIADNQEILDKAQENLDELNRKHRERIRAMEEGGKVSYWQVIFEANSFTDMLDRMNMVEEISDADHRRLEEMELAAQKVEDAQNTMQKEQADLEDSKALLEATQATMELKRAQSDEVLRQLLDKEAEIAVLLDAASEKMNALMDEISAKEKEFEKAKYDEYLA